MTKNQNSKEFPNYTFGVELETFGVNGAVLSWALRRAGLNVVGAFAEDGGNASTRRQAREQGSWDLGEDGSIRGSHPIEIRSPVLSGRKGLKDIERVCRVLKEVGSEVNASCGLHVHIGITNAAAQGMKPFTAPEILSILKRYHQWEKSIDGFLAAGRRENKNQYCKSLDRLIGAVEQEVQRAQGQPVAGPVLVDAEWGRQNSMNTRGCDCADCQVLVVDQENRRREDQHRRVTGRRIDLNKPETLAQFGDHYDKVSVQPLTKYGTIEFRQHHGSIDAKEITNWIRFLMNHIEVSRRLYAASEARKAALKAAEGQVAVAPVPTVPAVAQTPEGQPKAAAPRLPKDRDVLTGLTASARKHFKGQANRFSPRPRKPKKASAGDVAQGETPAPPTSNRARQIYTLNVDGVNVTQAITAADTTPQPTGLAGLREALRRVTDTVGQEPTPPMPQPPPSVAPVQEVQDLTAEALNRISTSDIHAQLEHAEALAQNAQQDRIAVVEHWVREAQAENERARNAVAEIQAATGVTVSQTTTLGPAGTVSATNATGSVQSGVMQALYGRNYASVANGIMADWNNPWRRIAGFVNGEIENAILTSMNDAVDRAIEEQAFHVMLPEPDNYSDPMAHYSVSSDDEDDGDEGI